MAETIARAWTFELYPESAPENWETLLRDLKTPLFYRLHDKDVKEDGTPKKTHAHVVLYFGGKKSLSQVRSIASRFGVDYAEPVLEWKAMCRYLCHLDNPEKAQYDIVGVVALGGLNYRDVCVSKDEQAKEDGLSLTKVILSFDCADWSDVVAFVMETRPELLHELKKYAYFYSSIIKSNNEKKWRRLDQSVLRHIECVANKNRAEWERDHTYVDSRELPPSE